MCIIVCVCADREEQDGKQSKEKAAQLCEIGMMGNPSKLSVTHKIIWKYEINKNKQTTVLLVSRLQLVGGTVGHVGFSQTQI